jgi:hypothetical protein
VIVGTSFAGWHGGLPVPEILSHFISQEASTDQIQLIGCQISVQPVYIKHMDIGDGSYAQVMDVPDQPKSSGIGQVVFEANFYPMH